MILEKRHVLVGIGFDGHARELLDWALEKVAQSGDSVAALHVCRNSDSISKAQVLMDGYLADYQEICNQKKVGISVEVVKGSSIRKLLVREAKNRSSAVVIVGINKNSPLGLRGKVSIAKYCAKKLPLGTEVMAVHNKKVVYSSCSNGSQINPSPNSDVLSEFGDSEVSKDDVLSGGSSFLRRAGKSLSSISLPVEEFTQQKPGWPLLQTASEVTQISKAARKMSVVQWVMTLPNRSSMLEFPQLKSNFDSDFENLALKLRSNKCKLFNYEILKAATCQFSSDNLIGKGGCNSVYKGVLPDGKIVAIKVLKSSAKDSWKWKEFALEVEIMTAIKHKNITRLLGICVADDSLISVHNLLPKGNLEENLHGNNVVLPWEVRLKIAIGIGEALNYLHNECVQPVIHRDVKSSNILLTDEFNPQLSDFGLSIWGPTEAASFITDSDLVGTFGYLAPEYFMYGKVSDKVDVYSFGVVLLELLSGRRAIGSEVSKGEESLVIWAKPKLDSGDLDGILDQNLGKAVDVPQMQRMALAAKKCLTQAARLRPHMNQVLKILNGEESEMSGENDDQLEGDCEDDEEVYPDSSAAESSHLGIALRDVYDNSGSFSSQDQSSPLSVEEYLRRRWSRSSSLE